MKRISNVKVYDLEESLIASGYPMRTELIERQVDANDIKRAKNLIKASKTNGAHGQFLTGIRVNFDLRGSNKFFVEAERYRFLEFVSSQSTMHRITKFKLKDQCNKYVDDRIIDIVQKYIDEYNRLANLPASEVQETMEKRTETMKELYLTILYNVPSGFELTARMTTNYRCLLNIYNQRRDHRLPEWREFCEDLEELPMFYDFKEAYLND